MGSVRAYQTDAIGTRSIVYHKSAGEARYATFRCANGAGFDVALIDIKALRRPDLDRARVYTGSSPELGRCYCEDALQPLTDGHPKGAT